MAEAQVNDHTTKLSFRLNTAVTLALTKCAKAIGYEPMAYVQRVLTAHAIESDYMPPQEKTQIDLNERFIDIAVKRARELYDQGVFNGDFVLTVFRDLMKNQKTRHAYEEAVGGNAYIIGLPGKTPLNMYLGWYIKNAVGADPQMLNGKPVRVQVKNEPIQSYTRLVMPTS